MDELEPHYLDEFIYREAWEQRTTGSRREGGRTRTVFLAPVAAFLSSSALPQGPHSFHLNTLPITLVWEGVSFLCNSVIPDQDGVSHAVSPTPWMGAEHMGECPGAVGLWKYTEGRSHSSVDHSLRKEA